jgi:hypothetical protein
LGEFLTILLAEGKIRKNMATSATPDAIFSQSILPASMNKPLKAGAKFFNRW